MRAWTGWGRSLVRAAGRAGLVALAGVCALQGGAATYFVSQSTGNDSNSGTIQGLPWKTLSKVGSTNLQPGDSVLLKRGDVWRESLFVLRSGTQLNPLTFGAYGSGALPIIEGTDTLTGITSLGGNNYRVTTAATPEALVLNGVVGRRVANLGALSQQGDWFPESGTSAVFRSASAPASVDVTTRQFGIVMNQVQDVNFSNLHVRHAYDPVWIYNARRVSLNLVQVQNCVGYAGFFLSADASGYGSFNIINECIVTNQRGSGASLSFGNDGCGIFVYSTGLNDNNTFTNNLVTGVGHEGIALLSTSNNLIASNTVSGSGSAGIRIAGPTSGNNTIEHNESFGNCNLQDDRFGIDLLDVFNNNVVRYNFVHEQGQVPGGEFKSGGIRFDGGDFSNSQNQTSTGNIAYYNTVFGEYIGINVFNASNVTILNNTVIDCTGYAITFNGVSTLIPLNNTALNNVVRMLDEGLFFENGVAGSTIDYNIYQSGSGSFFVSAGAFHTWDTWRSQRGFDVHGKMGELGLVDPVAFDFRLTATSPAVNAGTSVGLVEDFLGTVVPQGGVVDAGAYEFVPGPAPTVSIGAPSPVLTRSGPVDFSVTYTGANTVNLTAGGVTLNKTGSANGIVSVLNGTTATPTVRVGSITGNGTLGISIAAGTATDVSSTPSLPGGPSATVEVDNTAPSIQVSAASATLTRGGPVDFAITYTGANTVNLVAGNVTLNKTGSANGTVSVLNGTTATPTVRISGITGDGTLGITLAAGTASDTAGNTAAATGASATFSVDNTAPGLSLGAPSATLTRGGPVDFGVTYTGASTVNLVAGNVTLNKTGSANGTVSVLNGTTATPTVRVSGITGNGTLSVSVAAGTASDAAGNTAAGAGPSTAFTVDNTAPTVSIGSAGTAVTRGGPVDFGITYGGANTVSLTGGSVTLNKTGSANGTVSVLNGTTATPTVRISGITGDGTLGISIASGTASDTAGNTAAGAGPSGTFTVDNTAPVVTLGSPSAGIAKGGPVDIGVSYSGAATVNLVAGNVTLNKTGSANGTVSVLNGTTATPTVRISGITGDGTLGISLASSTAGDAAGNSAAGAGPSGTFTVDNTPPSLVVGAPLASLTRTGPVDFPITYGGASSVNLSAANVTLNKTGTANGTVNVLNGTTATPTVRISSVSGDGTLGISIAGDTATDTAGNAAAAAGPSNVATVDNTAPGVSIGSPSTFLTRGGPVDYVVTYAGADTVNLTSGQVTLNATGSAAGTVSVLNGSTATPTVRISGISGDGTLGISFAANTASDAAGNSAVGAGPSIPFVVDNTAPAVALGAPSVSLTRGGPVDIPVTYTGAGTVTLSAANVSLNVTGTAGASIAVLNGNSPTPVIRLSEIVGDGSLGVSVAAGTGSDGAGNTAPGAGPSVTFVVDNTAPTVLLGAPSTPLTNTGPVDFPVTISGATAIALNAELVTLNGTGNASGTVGVLNGSTATPTIRVSGVSGDGTLSVSVAAGVASDSAGNTASGAGQSASVTVDNTGPAVSIGTPSVSVTRSGPVDFPISYTGAQQVSLLAGDVLLQPSGTATAGIVVLNGTSNTPVVRLENVVGNGSLAISLSAGNALDAAGNTDDGAGPSSGVLVDNEAPVVSVGSPSTLLTRGGPVEFAVSVSNADTVNLAADDVLVDTTGTVSASVVVVDGASNTPTIRLENVSGDGSVGVRVAAGVAVDTAGNASAATLAGTLTAVDNTPPTATITQADPVVTNQNVVRWVVDFSEPVGSSFSIADVSLGGSLGGEASVTGISGPGAGEVFTVSAAPLDPGADGSLSLIIGTEVTDAAGNAFAGGLGGAYTLVNLGPSIEIGAPSAGLTAGDAVSYTVSYTDAGSISLNAGDVSVVATGTANAVVSVSGSGLAERVVTLENITGDGTLGILIGADSARDVADNPAPAAGPSATFTVDTTAPDAVITQLDPAVTRLDTVRWLVDFDEPVGDSFSASDVRVGGTLAGLAAVSAVTPSGNDGFEIAVSLVDGNANGELFLVIDGVVTDVAGNAYAGGQGAAYTLDNVAPGIVIGAPSSALTRGGPVSYTVSYSDAETVLLSLAQVELLRAGTANAAVEISGTGSTRTVTLSGVAGDGSLGIRVLEGSAVDLAGNAAPAGESSVAVVVDNTAPTATVTQLDPTPTSLDSVRWQVDFSEPVLPSLAAGNVVPGGTLVAAEASVSGPGAGDVYVVTLAPVDPNANGTLSCTLSGILNDAAGNAFAGAAGDPYVVEHVIPEGAMEGVVEGVAEGSVEGTVEGVAEGLVEGVVEGSVEGVSEGLAEGVAEGAPEGQPEGVVEGPFHTADRNGDRKVSLSELLRVIQLFAQGGLRCSTVAEDGFDSGVAPRDCTPHAADYNPQDWRIRLNELLRVIQLYNAEGYVPNPGIEDGFALS